MDLDQYMKEYPLARVHESAVRDALEVVRRLRSAGRQKRSYSLAEPFGGNANPAHVLRDQKNTGNRAD